MKKVIKLTERDLSKIVKRVLNEDLEMMDVSSDSDYYKSKRREVSVPGDDLSVLIALSKKWCEESGYKMGGRMDDISMDECRTVAKLNRTYLHI